MPKKTPLSYLSAKAVVPYLDFNTRFFLSKRCQVFPTMEKNALISIQRFEMNPHEIKINNVTFQLGVIQVYNNHQTPRAIQAQNDQGGLPYDVDKYGLQDNRLPENTHYEDVYLGVSRSRWKLNDLRKQREDAQYKYDRFPLIHKKYHIEEVEEKIEDIECKMLAVDLQNRNANPPYTNYLQLIITSKDGRYVERVAYEERSLQKALTYLFNKLINRREVYIRELKADFIVRQVLDYIRPSIQNNLKVIEMNRMIENDAIVESAEMIILSQVWIATVLPQLSHNRVHFRNFNTNYDFLVEFSKRRETEVGKHYSLDMDDRGSAVRAFERYSENPGPFMGAIPETKETEFHLCVTFPKFPDQEVNIYLEKTEDLYIFNVKVSPKGYSAKKSDIPVIKKIQVVKETSSVGSIQRSLSDVIIQREVTFNWILCCFSFIFTAAIIGGVCYLFLVYS